MKWILGAFFILLGIGLTIRIIKRSDYNSAILNRFYFKNLTDTLMNELDYLREHGIPNEYVARYRELIWSDYVAYKKGIRELLKEMTKNKIDIMPIGELIERIKETYGD